MNTSEWRGFETAQARLSGYSRKDVAFPDEPYTPDELLGMEHECTAKCNMDTCGAYYHAMTDASEA